MPGTTSNDLDFLYELGTLRNMRRGWHQHVMLPTASVMEHTLRVIWLAIIIGKMENADLDKITRMALVHDLTESRTSDHSYVEKVYVKENDELAARDIFEGTSLTDYEEAWNQFESRESIEAKIVKDADNLDVDLEMRELEEQGSKLPKKWAQSRKLIRETKLYTESAKKIWDEIQTSDVSNWHLIANKWVKLPNAGK
ncbi:MAG: HD domain-containing protein [Acidobacteriaceae bacterium]